MPQFIPPQIKKYPFEYAALAIILLVPAITFLRLSGDPHDQRRVVYAGAALYFLWSLYHHYRRGDLHISIIIEYLAMAALGVLFLTSTLIG